VKLLIIFDPVDLPRVARLERTQEGAITWLAAQDFPAAFRVHEHRIGDDADTILCVMNGEFCWPDPVRAWKVTNNATLTAIAPPRAPAAKGGA
jgi:hypothetical protein